MEGGKAGTDSWEVVMKRGKRLVALTAVLACVMVGSVGLADAVGEIEPNESQATAMALGTFGEGVMTVEVDAEIDYPGDSDWYTFTVEHSGALVLASAAEDLPLQLVLYGGDTTYIAAAERAIDRTFEPGAYLLRVSGEGLSLGEYTLAVSNAVEVEPNDSLGGATNLGTLSGDGAPITMYGALDPISDVDRFVFDVQGEKAGEARVALDGPGDDDTLLVLVRFDPGTGETEYIDRDDDSGRELWSEIHTSLAPGRYVAMVTELGSNDVVGLYSITISWAHDACEPNDEFTTACHLGQLSVDAMVASDGAWSFEDVDFFRFDLIGDALITILVDGPFEGDSVVALYDSTGTMIAENDDRLEWDYWSRVSRRVQSGSYVMQVEGSEWAFGSFDYTVTVAAAEAPECLPEREPNGELPLATSLGGLPACAEGRVSDVDIDIYSFVLEVPTVVYMETYGSEGADSYMILFDEFGFEVDYNDDGGSGRWSRLALELPPGEYFISVESYSGDAFDYCLLVTD